MTDSDTQPALEPGFFGEFPTHFSIHHIPDQDSSRRASHWVLATTSTGNKDANPEDDRHSDAGTPRHLYAVTHDTSKPHSIILHSGPDPESSTLGFAGERKILTQTTLLGIPGRSAVAANHTETMSLKVGTSSDEIYRWTFPVPTTDGRHETETFEWRRHVFDKHRELVRLGTGTWKDLDRREVVATWDSLSYRDDEHARLGTAHFTGSGATSEMGPEWRLMAVMTMLRLVSLDNVWDQGAGPRDVAGLLVRGAAVATALGSSVIPLAG